MYVLCTQLHTPRGVGMRPRVRKNAACGQALRGINLRTILTSAWTSPTLQLAKLVHLIAPVTIGCVSCQSTTLSRVSGGSIFVSVGSVPSLTASLDTTSLLAYWVMLDLWMWYTLSGQTALLEIITGQRKKNVILLFDFQCIFGYN